MADDQGVVQSVEVKQFGSFISVAADAAATSITVEAAADFNADGGQVSITSDSGGGVFVSTVYTYTAVDKATGVLTLSTGLTYAAAVNDRADIFPLTVVKYAHVLTESTGDTITARVPTSLFAYLPEGIRETSQQEPVSLVLDGGTWYVDDILGLEPMIDGSLIDPTYLNFSTSDGDPPVAATTVSTRGGLGMIFVRWPGITNADFVSYELHCATDNGTPPVAGDADTLLMETASTLVAVKQLPDGTPFAYETLYYFAVIAKDADGAGPASDWSAGSMDQTATADIAAGSITAETVEAVMALVSTISTRQKDAGGVLTGAGTDITNAGVYCWKSDGTTRFELPNDPLLPAVFRGDAEIDNLTVSNLTTLQSSQLAQGATLTLQSSIQPPSNAPTAQVYYQTQQFYAYGGYWTSRYGWTTDGTYSYTWDANNQRIEKYSNSSGSIASVSSSYPTPEGWTYNGSVTYDPMNNCLWLWQFGGFQYRLSKFTTGLAYVSSTTKAEPPSSSNVGTIAYDADHDELVVAQTRSSDQKMVWYRYNNDASTAYQGSIVSSTTFSVTTMCAIRTTADLGFDCVISGSRGYTTPMQIYKSADGTRQTGLEWYNGSGTGKIGAYYNSTSGRFVMIDQNGVQYTYEKDGNWRTGSPDYVENWQASYTWYHSTGPKETTISDFATFSMPKRARLLLTGPSRPASVTAARFYLRKYAENFNLNDSYFQAESTASNPTIIITSAVFTGTTSPATSSFGNSVPSKIVSGTGGARADGEPKVKIVGDGSGRFDGLLPPGSITMYWDDNAPDGWLLCDGSEASRALYPDLFNTIGTTFGAGNGTTTFNLPDFRGRVPLGVSPGYLNPGDNEGDSVDQRDVDLAHSHDHDVGLDGGSHTHGINTVGDHSHNIQSTDHTGASNTTATGGANRVGTLNGTTNGSHAHGGNTGSNGSHDHSGQTHAASDSHDHGGLTGQSGLTYSDVHPFLSIAFLIKY